MPSENASALNNNYNERRRGVMVDGAVGDGRQSCIIAAEKRRSRVQRQHNAADKQTLCQVPMHYRRHIWKQ